MKTLVSISLVVAVLFVANGSAHAQPRGVQLTDDLSNTYAVMVTKQINGQQWAIIADLDNEQMTGNVFNLDGSGNPVFIRCDIVDPLLFEQSDFVGVTVTLDCFAADACTALPCGEEGVWNNVGERQIPGSFFLP